ncbi:MAG: aminomethyl-transferring glycine dehydrogenase subunit GcvPA [Methanobacteriota archaeon]|nr:MAG: aminomethyl-transferring glycine dehydrogenase subunit GcvPA [Euryarchaeota archaeon]
MPENKKPEELIKSKTIAPYQSYLGVSPQEVGQMLSELGLQSTMDLFSDVPSHLLLEDPLKIPGPYSEYELDRIFREIAKKNRTDLKPFLGGGVRQVYVPAFLEELMRRGEIYTAYTSYQPEVAQGMLQMIYEYESMIAELTDMDVVSASLYDWGTALGESARMMARIKRRNGILVAHPISPRRLDVLRSYTEPADIHVTVVDSQGDYDFSTLQELIEKDGAKEKKSREFAGLYLEVPTFHGVLSDKVEELISIAHENDILVTVGVDMISLGILKPPSSYGADFVIGEGQVFGNALNAGGPLLGILAMNFDRKKIQNFPGRLVGKTTELGSDHPGYCITLSTREQHIRREKATSNICSNQTLMAINAGIYLASLGPEGLRELAQGLMDRAHYLMNGLKGIAGVNIPYSNVFAEFLVEFEGISHEQLEKHCMNHGFIPGIKIDGPGCKRLVGVSDIFHRDDLDEFVNVIREVMS